MKRVRNLFVTVALVACAYAHFGAARPKAQGNPPEAAGGGRPELWLYYSANLQVADNVNKLQAVWGRAAAVGYTHVMIADSKFAKLHDVPDFYFPNLERTKRIAAELNLKLVPAVFSIGYSNNLLWNSPDLAEGLPVKDSPFVVQGGEARLVGDQPVAFDRIAFKDDAVELDEAAREATVRGHEGLARLTYKLKVRPFRCYHVAVKVKTDDYTGQPQIKALGSPDGLALQWQNLGVQPTQDWTEHHVVFNSLDHEEVNVYFGVWDGATGTLQWKDWMIEEVGLLNVLRRPGTPCVVTGEDGTEFVEGEDYEPIVDPRMGNVPYGGEYEVWHEPPAIRVKDAAKLPDGTRLRVSWYHPVVVYDGQVSACLSEPRLYEVLEQEARQMNDAFGPAAAGWVMSHDELRTANWCKACRDHNAEAGGLLADNAGRCVQILRSLDAAAGDRERRTLYVWSDMFDPHHNAVNGPYYLVRGDLTGSWEGLDKDVVILNWNHGQRDQSLAFFAERGHKQIIAGYYDDPSLQQMRDWLESAKGAKGVVGYMYTTWRNDYERIEAFAELCGVAPAGSR